MSSKNKKGFTLIEMLIVIAIIAILVAVIIPILRGSSDKAAAATNAANLRSIEGEVVSLMLLEPELFEEHNAEQVASVGTMLDYMVSNRDDAFAQYDQTQQNVADLQLAVANAQADLDAAKQNLENAETQAQLAQDALKTATDLVTAAEAAIPGLQTAVTEAQAAYDKIKDSKLVPTSVKKAAQSALTAAESELAGANEKLENLKADLNSKEAQAAAEAAIKASAEAAVAAAEATRQAAEQQLVAAQEALAAYEDDFKNSYDNQITDLEEQYYQLMYMYTAVDGVIDLNGATLKVPTSSAMTTDDLSIEKGVEMVVFVDLENKEAYAMYNGYRTSDFAKIAGEEEK